MATTGGVAGLCPRAQLVPFKMSLGEGFFHSIADPNVAFILINIGFLALIAWVFHPGFHVSLAVGVIAEVIGLAILETLPVELTGFILLLVAAVLFVLDVKARAHGVLTAGGIATLILGGLLLFNPSVPSAQVSRPLIVAVAVGAGLFAFFSLRALLAARGQPIRTKIVGEYQRLVLFRLGRAVGIKGPGLVWIFPIIDRVTWVDLRELYLEIPHQTAITEDNAPISIDFIIFYKVVDASMSVLQ